MKKIILFLLLVSNVCLGQSVNTLNTIAVITPVPTQSQIDSMRSNLYLQLATGIIPNSRLTTMAPFTIKGNNTGSSSVPLDLTILQIKTLLSLNSVPTDSNQLVKYRDTTNMLAPYLSSINANTANFSNYFPLVGGNLSGTAGNTFIGLPSQTTTPATPSSGFIRVYSDSLGRLSWKTSLGYSRTFHSSSLTANRSYKLMDYSYTLADSNDIALAVNVREPIQSGTGYIKSTSGTKSYVTAIPNSDLAVMPANTIKLNNTGSSAAPIDATKAQLHTFQGYGTASYLDSTNIATRLANSLTFNNRADSITTYAASHLTWWGDSFFGQGIMPTVFELYNGVKTVNNGVSGQNSTLILNRFLNDTASWYKPAVVCMGLNNVNTNTLYQATLDYATMTSKFVALGNNRYLYLTIPSSTNTNQRTGQPLGDSIVAFNNRLKAANPGHVADMQADLLALNLGNATGIDSIMKSYSQIPQTFRRSTTDSLHFSDSLYKLAVIKSIMKYNKVIFPDSNSIFTAGQFRQAMRDLYSPKLPLTVANIYSTVLGGAGNLGFSNATNPLFCTVGGFGAGQFLTTPQQVTAIGTNAMQNATYAVRSVAIGDFVGYNILTSNDQTGVGSQALFNSTGNHNTALGSNNMFGAFGYAPFNYCTSVGSNNLKNISTADSSLVIGQNSGNGLSTGTSNTIIGNGLEVPSGTGNQQSNYLGLIFGQGHGVGSTPATNPLLGIGTNAPTHTLTFGSSGSGISLYNVSDQTTNYERTRMYWSGNVFNITTDNGGTGTNRPLYISGGGRQLQLGGSTAFFSFNGTSSAVSSITMGVNGTTTAASGINNIVTINPTINQSSTAGYRALYVNPTLTTTGSGLQYIAEFGKTNNLGTYTGILTVDTAGNITAQAGSRIVGGSFSITSGGIINPSNNDNVMIFNNRSYTTAATAVTTMGGTITNSTGIYKAWLQNTTYNQTGSAGSTDFTINRIETALGSGAAKFIDFQVGGVSKFYVTTTGVENIQSQTMNATATVTSGVQIVYFNPASVVSAATITTPATPVDQQQLSIRFGGTIAANSAVVTTLTITANSGSSLYQQSAPTTANGGDIFVYQYEAATTLWRRIR